MTEEKSRCDRSAVSDVMFPDSKWGAAGNADMQTNFKIEPIGFRQKVTNERDMELLFGICEILTMSKMVEIPRKFGF